MTSKTEVARGCPWTGCPWEVHQADAVEWLKSLPAGSVDLLVTDPAYESLEEHRKKGTTTRLSMSKASSSKWFPIFPNSRFPELFEECYRVLKPGSHFYLFCDAATAFIVKPLAEAAGFKFWKPLIWDKVVIGMGYHYRARYEMILFFEKGKRGLTNLGTADVLTFRRVMRQFPTEKPLGLVEVLVNQSTRPGEVVCDPFLGSGVVGLAARNAGCRFVGCDVDPHAVEVSCARLAAE